jgi:hypothetical protein
LILYLFHNILALDWRTSHLPKALEQRAIQPIIDGQRGPTMSAVGHMRLNAAFFLWLQQMMRHQREQRRKRGARWTWARI